MSSSTSENIRTKSLANELVYDYQCGIFDEYYEELLNDFETKIIDRLSSNNYCFEINTETVLKSALTIQRQSLMNIATRSLMSEMYNYISNGTISRSDPKTEYKDFTDIISGNEFKAYFAEKYAPLMEILNKKNETMSDLILECIDNLNADADLIHNEFGFKIESLQEISPNSGDTHNNGKSVASVVVNNGTKIFYKPHSLDGDEFFRNFSKEFVKDKKFVDEIVKFVSCPDHGWQECVSYKPVTNISEAKKYFKNIGKYISLFYILGTEDMHYENIIASGCYPKFIDLESVLANKNTEWCTQQESLLSNMMTELKQSVFSSIIIPQNYEFTIFDIDLSGLTGGINENDSKNLTYFSLEDTFTSDIHYEKKQAKIIAAQNLLKLGDKIINPGEYVSDIIEGFEEIYNDILESKSDIISWLKKYAKGNASYRQILRATYMYGKFLDSSYHPKYLMSQEERKRLFSLLNGKNQEISKRTQIIEAEKKVLMNNDVPSFETKLDSNDIFYDYLGKTECIKNVYTGTMIDRITDKLNTLSEDDKRKQISYLKISLMNFSGKTINSLKEQNYSLWNLINNISDAPENELYLKTAEAVAESLTDKIIINKETGSCSIFELISKEDETTQIGYLKPDLYTGLGTLLFIGLTAFYSKNKKLENFMFDLDKGFAELYPFEIVKDQLTESAFNGITSYIYVYSILYRYYKNDLFKSRYKNALDILLQKDIDTFTEIDVISGLAGIIPVISELYRFEKDPKLAEFIEKAALKLCETVNNNADFELAGFAHGYAGVINALSEAYTIKSSPVFEENIIRLIDKENKLYNSQQMNWRDLRNKEKESYQMSFWCHGNGGISISRLAALKVLKNNEKYAKICRSDAEKFIKFILNDNKKKKNDCLCHGTMGNISILNSLKEEFTEYRDEINDYIKTNMKKMISEVIENGFCYQNKANIESVGFMTGLSGIGYGFLSLWNNKIPNVLFLKMERCD